MTVPDSHSTNHVDPEYAAIRDEVARAIRAHMRKHRIRGVSIALFDDQKTVWAEGFGYANVRKKIPASAQTVYRVGSISKLFTDTAVMQLVEQGKMDIDQPLSTYVPDFSIRSRFADADPITPRNIMTHHSGLPDSRWKGLWGDPEATFTQLPALLKDEYVAYPPNKIFAYSNLGLSLLGLAVQNASGESYVSYMDTHVLQPLGMTHSSFELTPAVRSLLSEGYRNGKVHAQPVLRDLPAGGLYSTVEDMARFGKMVFAGGCSGNRQILQAGSLAEMLRSQTEDVPLDMGFSMGLGWMIAGENDYMGSGPVIGHGGVTLYFGSQITLLPEHKLGVVVLTNSRKGVLFIAKLIDRVATQALRLALQQKTGVAQPTEASRRRRKIVRPSPAVLESLPGHYATMAVAFSVQRKRDRLYAMVGKKKLYIDVHDDGTFGVHFPLFGVFKIRGPWKDIAFSVRHIDGHDVVVHHEAGRAAVIGEKVTLPPIPNAWRQRLGDYELVNPDAAMPLDRIRLTEHDRALQFRVRSSTFTRTASTVTLLPISETDALVAGLGRGQRETVQITVRDGTEYLNYSGFACRRVGP